MIAAYLTCLTSYLPEATVSSADVEAEIWRRNPHLRPMPGIIEATTGIRSRHVAADDQYPSTLAAAASRRLFEIYGVEPASIELLLFAAAGQDLIEPATSVIIQDDLGLDCPAFDIKNACNSVLNAIETADGLITAGRYANALIVTGETPSRAVKYDLRDRQDFKASFAGFTFGDAGAALLLEGRHRTAEPAGGTGGSVLWQRFATRGRHWQAGTLPGGGGRHPRGDEYSYFTGDAAGMVDGFLELGPGLIDEALVATGTRPEQLAAICIHQPSVPIADLIIAKSGLPADKIVRTAADYGNMAAATLPFALQTIWDGLQSGDRVLLVGFAGGISLGITIIER